MKKITRIILSRAYQIDYNLPLSILLFLPILLSFILECGFIQKEKKEIKKWKFF